jgi:hypothetical protein
MQGYATCQDHRTAVRSGRRPTGEPSLVRGWGPFSTRYLTEQVEAPRPMAAGECALLYVALLRKAFAVNRRGQQCGRTVRLGRNSAEGG